MARGLGCNGPRTLLALVGLPALWHMPRVGLVLDLRGPTVGPRPWGEPTVTTASHLLPEGWPAGFATSGFLHLHPDCFAFTSQTTGPGVAGFGRHFGPHHRQEDRSWAGLPRSGQVSGVTADGSAAFILASCAAAALSAAIANPGSEGCLICHEERSKGLPADPPPAGGLRFLRCCARLTALSAPLTASPASRLLASPATPAAPLLTTQAASAASTHKIRQRWR